MNPEIERRGDHEKPAWFEQAENLVEGSAHLEDMFEGLDTKDSAGRGVRQVDGRHVFDQVNAGPGPHVAADKFAARKQRAKIGEAFLAIDLKGAELEDRARAVDCLGRQAAKRLVVVAHRRGSSLSQAGAEGQKVQGNAQTASPPPAYWVWGGS